MTRAVLSDRERRQERRLGIVLAVTVLFFAFELGGAILADSDVLKADALHLQMDVLAIGMALVAIRVASRRPSARFTFGLRRAEPVAAVLNAGLVLAAVALIVGEAVGDLRAGTRPRADIMLVVAGVAVGINGVNAWLVHDAMGDGTGPARRGRDHDPAHAHAHAHGRKGVHTLNLRAAWLHLLGDALGSVAALVAAIAIRAGAPAAVDPIASFAVAIVLVVAAVRLLREAVLVLLEAAPGHLPVARVREVAARETPGGDVHDVHVWTLGAGHDVITLHVAVAAPDGEVGPRVEAALRRAFGVEYVTVQVEPEGCACRAPPSRYEGSDAAS